MTDTEPNGQAIDPPDNQGGGTKAELDAPADEAPAIDPPSNDGGS